MTAETLKLEELLEAGEVKHALLLKGSFTGEERILAQRAYQIGRESMRGELAEVRAALEDLLRTHNGHPDDIGLCQCEACKRGRATLAVSGAS